MFAGGEATSAEVLIVAPLVLDDIDAPEASARGVLGGSGAYAALAARHFAPTALASVVGSDFPPEHLGVLRGVRLRLTRVEGASFRWRGAHAADGATRTLRNDPGATDGVLPPLDGGEGAFVLLGAFAPALQRRIHGRLVSSARFVALDTMPIHIAAEPGALRALLAEVDAAFLTADEERLLGSADATILVVKRGGAGAVVRWRDRELSVPAFPVRVNDPTGAGDAFAGAFLATLAAHEGRLESDVLLLAGARGAAAASFAVEALGTRALASATRDAIEERASALPVALA